MKNLVVVHYDEAGQVSYFVNGEDIRLFIIDERAPNDRIYEWLSRDSSEEIEAVMRDDRIGSSADERHEAIKHKILKRVDGKRHLEPVK